MEALKTLERSWKIKIAWNFYAPMHGKSVVDGIGGSVKRFVRSRILAQKLNVTSSFEFVEVAKNMEGIRVLLLDTAAIDDRNKSLKLENIIKSLKKIKIITSKLSPFIV